jgi:hypothetical protein
VTFYATPDATIPPTLDGWGEPIGPVAFDAAPSTVVSPIPSAPAMHMLVLLNEIGTDPGCTDENPYRGAIGEITATS